MPDHLLKVLLAEGDDAILVVEREVTRHVEDARIKGIGMAACPICGERQVHTDEAPKEDEPGSNELTQDVHCQSCGAGWVYVYRISHLVSLHLSDGTHIYRND